MVVLLFAARVPSGWLRRAETASGPAFGLATQGWGRNQGHRRKARGESGNWNGVINTWCVCVSWAKRLRTEAQPCVQLGCRERALWPRLERLVATDYA